MVSGSHGGIELRRASRWRCRLRLVFFNDAGVGKDARRASRRWRCCRREVSRRGAGAHQCAHRRRARRLAAGVISRVNDQAARARAASGVSQCATAARRLLRAGTRGRARRAAASQAATSEQRAEHAVCVRKTCQVGCEQVFAELQRHQVFGQRVAHHRRALDRGGHAAALDACCATTWRRKPGVIAFGDVVAGAADAQLRSLQARQCDRGDRVHRADHCVGWPRVTCARGERSPSQPRGVYSGLPVSASDFNRLNCWPITWSTAAASLSSPTSGGPLTR